ncbi:abscisic acid ABA receptor [Colletotrichum navitas]|uniref:Abscisic acid ABA receptor n=1 Tax=Colletotrichum navitas TaxID=681940 RepID=A0AAD8Q0G8_9PEZI|nr:abscisic acid ABA receptor [Colletotrichum navitas]KAK1590457.1 abscisic acid ABA receptor [Colletotrichum navitas]
MPQLTPAQPRFIRSPSLPQDYLPFTEHSETLVQEALVHILVETPPRELYTRDECRGLFRGPTALAYLLLRIHAVYPAMRIHGQSLQHWVDSYMAPQRTGGNSAPCGLACESAGYYAVKTILDETEAPKFREELERLVEEDNHPYELLFGFAGLLYMVRAVELSRPETASLLATAKARIIERILGAGPGWTWRGKRYIGAVHGDVGILTQLLLTDSKLAKKSMVRNSLQRLLSLQHQSGNWPTEDTDHGYHELVQFCHGAPGFVSSLLQIGQFFPDMNEQIENAIALGRRCIWQQGLLKKEPCLCHGLLGNSFGLPSGTERNHFLAWSLPSKVEEERQRDGLNFSPEDGKRMCIWFNYWPSAAWTWTVCEADAPGVILYSDV